MKFKKPTIIGVVLTLVLVLGVSIAFASDPKTPDEDADKTADMSAADPAGEVMDGHDVDDYTVVEPEIDGQGNSVIRDEDGNIIIVGIRTASGEQVPCEEPGCQVAGAHFHDTDGKVVQVHYEMPGQLCIKSGCRANGAHEHWGISYDACAATCTPKQYAGLLDAWVTLGAMDRQEADGWLEIFRTCYDHVQAGDSDAFHYNTYDGTTMSAAWYISDRAAAGYPVNSKGETYGSDMPEVYGASPDLIAAMGTNSEGGYIEGYVRASELNDTGYPGGVNNPEQALAYMEWLKTQPAERCVPLYDQEGNVIGQFGVSNPVAENASWEQAAAQDTPQVNVQVSVPAAGGYPVCHVDGCNTVGQHTHNGTTYCGGLAHNGSTCDGNCGYNTPASTPSGSHHQESTGGHHGNGHH